MRHAYICLLAAYLLLSGCTGCGRRRSGDPEDRTDRSSGRAMVPMERANGVRYVEIKINGAYGIKAIFDTGASNVSITSLEVLSLLKQRDVRQEDFLEKTAFMDASGNISEGTKLILRSVEIGGITLDSVEATVVDNIQAPVLLGQSVLERFDRICIDNRADRITLE